jgi:hypothetical protein
MGHTRYILPALIAALVAGVILATRSQSDPSPPPAQALLACENSVSGATSEGAGLDAAVQHGPITFFGIRDSIGRPPFDEAGRSLSVKSFVVLNKGQSVTVAVATRDTSKVALLYEPTAFSQGQGSYYLFDLGVRAVTFTACPDRDSGFVGGFIIHGPPRCVAVDVYLPGEVERVQLPFAGAPCS